MVMIEMRESEGTSAHGAGVAASAASLCTCTPGNMEGASICRRTARKIEKMVRFGAFWCMAGAQPAKLSEFRGVSGSDDASAVHQKVVHLVHCGAQTSVDVPQPALAARP